MQKVNAKRRLMEVITTSADLDRQSHIILLDVVKCAFVAAVLIHQVTLAVGEMYQAKAVGKLTQWKPDDKRRAGLSLAINRRRRRTHEGPGGQR